MTQTLAQLLPGESGRVAALDFPSRKARRMEDLGFLPGQRVTALHTAPFGGIVAYQVLDTVIALRDTDARRITLQRKKMTLRLCGTSSFLCYCRCVLRRTPPRWRAWRQRSRC